MVRKFAWPVVILIIAGVVQDKYSVIDNHLIFNILIWLIMGWVVFSVVRHARDFYHNQEVPEFVMDQLYNAQPCYPLKSAGEQRAACAESLFLIGGTGRYPTSISYINSLE
ncbi:hypothetical protein [Kluyvera genomosp. 1]|uniref:hypothetical protein n=1 Tax=Kluyvera genomosp. 1 TaxID=2774053 RepID=UPI0012E1F4CB|nr:hypothetical protein [Kluyvera genomosp. 1]